MWFIEAPFQMVSKMLIGRKYHSGSLLLFVEPELIHKHNHSDMQLIVYTSNSSGHGSHHTVIVF